MRVTVICLFAVFGAASSFRCGGLTWGNKMHRAGVLLRPVGSVKQPVSSERLDPLVKPSPVSAYKYVTIVNPIIYFAFIGDGLPDVR